MLNLLSDAATSFQIDGLGALSTDPLDVTGLVAVILAFSLPAVIVVAVLIFRLRSQRLQNEIITRLVAAGQPVPQELLVAAARTQRSNLNRGLTMLAVGAAMALAFWLTDNHAWPYALIPVAVGIARLVAWAVEDRPAGPAR